MSLESRYKDGMLIIDGGEESVIAAVPRPIPSGVIVPEWVVTYLEERYGVVSGYVAICYGPESFYIGPVAGWIDDDEIALPYNPHLFEIGQLLDRRELREVCKADVQDGEEGFLWDICQVLLWSGLVAHGPEELARALGGTDRGIREYLFRKGVGGLCTKK